MNKNAAKPTLTTYTELQIAYDFFNAELFGGQLPECIMTLSRKSKYTAGYFAPERYKNVVGEIKDELAMNPAFFNPQSLIDTLAVLVHEMCHVWQEHFGEMKSARAYHNKEWAAQMKRIGLMPSSTGAPGGAETGQKMRHYIIKGGPFEQACHRLLTDEFKISWAGMEAATCDEVEPVARSRNKIKHFCVACGDAAWGKPDLRLICGKCDTKFISIHEAVLALLNEKGDFISYDIKNENLVKKRKLTA